MQVENNDVMSSKEKDMSFQMKRKERAGRPNIHFEVTNTMTLCPQPSCY